MGRFLKSPLRSSLFRGTFLQVEILRKESIPTSMLLHCKLASSLGTLEPWWDSGKEVGDSNTCTYYQVLPQPCQDYGDRFISDTKSFLTVQSERVLEISWIPLSCTSQSENLKDKQECQQLVLQQLDYMAICGKGTEEEALEEMRRVSQRARPYSHSLSATIEITAAHVILHRCSALSFTNSFYLWTLV